jgi:hypothetical protein
MKHIKLFETRSLLRDQFKEFINFLNIDEDSLEVMLNWSAQRFGISPDALAVTSVERSEAEYTMRGNPRISSIHLDSDGLGQVGIHKLYYTEVFTREEYTQIRDGIKLEHPELFKSRTKASDQWRLIDLLGSLKSARYGIVFAWGPAGYFSIVPRGRAAV